MRLALPAFVVALPVALLLAARAGAFPLVNCPPDITNPSSVPTVINYGAVCGVPLGDEIQSFACVPPSGSTFPVGITTVTCTCIDVAGNTSTCSFTVGVGPTAAGAPAMTPWGLLTAAGVLAGIAGLALRRRLLKG
ncbi:MAG TPA: HYR domain-containing protein [Candidatus Dormibacteraeota bacterium]|nr:HYR domain-containing protein [Candidatus Dormibacteraeota bacterium]